jgi:protection-of-telomeres protein 1
MLPSGFSAINDAKDENAIVSLLGVIVSVQEPRKTRGTDWVLEFAIQDDFSVGSIGSDATINCRLFRPVLDKFPKITGVGDVALIRNFKLSPWGHRVDAVFTQRSGALVFPGNKIPVPALSEPVQAGKHTLPYSAMFGTKDPTIQEQIAVINLKAASMGSVQQIQQYSSTASVRVAPPPEKLCLIKDMDFLKYYDVRAQVINIYYNNMGAVDLKITDYTENKDLFRYVDPDDDDYGFQQISWEGPYGQFTISVTLYENNAIWARDNLAVGDYVFLRNMRTKMSQANKLEGVLHQDRQRPNQIDIRKLIKSSDIAEINRRREEYEKSRTKKSAFDKLQKEPNKPSAKASANKKAEKRAKQRAQKEQEHKEIEEKLEKHEAARSGVNNNIRAAFPEAQLSTISEIIYNPNLHAQTPRYNDMTYPFLNCRHRSRVRVVDFFPPELSLFAHCTSDPAWDKRSKKQVSANGPPKGRWEWAFVLLLEDAKIPPNTVSEKLRVVVNNESAQYLLGMDAQECVFGPAHI